MVLNVKIITKDPTLLPKYQTIGAAGMDIHSNNSDPLVMKPGQRVLVPSGLYIELPVGVEAQIRPRSGLALKHGITVLNSPATIDSDYRGEYLVLLINHGQESYTIQPGDRIAQVIFAKYETVEWQIVSEIIESSTRSKKGFGSTGS